VWPASVIALAGLATYGNSLFAPFIFDDFNSIVYNSRIHEWWRLGTVLFPPARSSVAGRPLVSFSLAVNYALGGLDVRGYHAWNIAVHILCALVIFGVVRRTLELPALRSTFGSSATSLAFWSALLWELHPLNSEAVDYVIQRTESMMALFCLLTLYASIRAIESRAAAWWGTAAVTSCALGMACKESMAVTPLLVVAYDSTYVFGPGDGIKRAIAGRWRLYAGLAMSWLLLIALIRSGPRSNTVGFSNDDGVSAWVYLLNQSRMVTQYLHQTIWPRLLVVNYGYPRLLTLGEVAPDALLVVCLLLLTLIGLLLKPKLGFLGAWFFVTLAPTSSVVPITTEAGAERRMYLPLISVVVLAVVGGFLLLKLIERHWNADPIAAGRTRQYGGAAVLAIVAILCAARTVARNREYASPRSLLAAAVEGWPAAENEEALAKVLLGVGAHEEGLARLRTALPLAPRLHFNLGAELLNDGKLEEGLAHLQTVIAVWMSPPPGHLPAELPSRADVVSAREILGGSFSNQRRWSDAAEQFRQILIIDPSNVQAHRLLGATLFAQEAFEEAIVHYRAYLSVQPADADALGRLAVALIATGRIDEGIAAFQRTVEIAPNSAAAERNLAYALLDRGNIDDAAVHARRALRISPDDAGARDVLARALAGARRAGRE
jgi:tetratricopeptide (TPR) repeat protein